MFVGWLSAVAFVVHVALSWIFVSKLNLGIPGAMSAMIIASWFIVIGQFVYSLAVGVPIHGKDSVLQLLLICILF